MTEVRVRLFGPAREAVGAEVATVRVADPATAGAVVAALAERHPALAAWLPRSRVVVNLEYVEPSTPVSAGDEVAILPPVGGG